MSKSKINPKGSSWDELEKQLFTSEEIAESEVRVAIINEMIKAREENGITQKQLEAMSGIKQPVISRMENGTSDPQLSTVLKILNSLGKILFQGNPEQLAENQIVREKYLGTSFVLRKKDFQLIDEQRRAREE